MTLDISNPGAEPLQVNGVTSDEGSFRPLSDSFTVDPGQSQGVEVQFAPVAMSGVSGTLTISHSASGG